MSAAPGTSLPALGSGLADLPETTELLVVGLGITGAGVALDAAARGLTTLAVDAVDVAFGTSRWSSKLVHGGLRYLARGQVGVAHESAVERGLLMERTAPHLVRALPMMMPLGPGLGRGQGALTELGLRAGDLLRLGAGTRRTTLPPPRRLGRGEALTLAPTLRREGLRGGLLSWDGQLEDDARLVLAVARTAVREGAVVRTRVRVESVDPVGSVGSARGDGARGVRVRLRDTVTGELAEVHAGAVVNATGVWADRVAPGVRLRPSRGTHLVLPGELLGSTCAVMAPVPGATNRFVFALPQHAPDAGPATLVGLTDDPVDRVEDVPAVPEGDVDFLLDVVGRVLERTPRREEVLGAFAGLRPLLDGGGATSSADLSRRHAVLHDPSRRMVTVVGGKLTTYRRMAQDALDELVGATGLRAGRCRTRDLPLVGAADASPSTSAVPARLVRRFGSEAGAVLASAAASLGADPAEVAAPVAEDSEVTLAELVFGVTHEAARDVEDLLDRRTRSGWVPERAERVRPAAERALRVLPVR